MGSVNGIYVLADGQVILEVMAVSLRSLLAKPRSKA
jgi:hypothetical protein